MLDSSALATRTHVAQRCDDSELTQAELHDRQLGALQDEVAQLFAEVHALTYRALVKLALFDERHYWAGYQSCAHWMNFRLGISFTTAREHLRVARALVGLPFISKAFASGTLSYSKVRAVTRIANEKNDDELARLASAGTAGQVDKVVRACRKLSLADAQAQVAERGVMMGIDDDGMFFMRVRLMPDEGARLASLVAQFTAKDRERDVAARRADAMLAICELAAVGAAPSDVSKTVHGICTTELVVHVDKEVLDDPTAEGRAQVERPSFDSADARSSGRAKFFDAQGVEIPDAPPQSVVDPRANGAKPFEGARWDWIYFDYRRQVNSLAASLRKRE
jgi:hypothetical protein